MQHEMFKLLFAKKQTLLTIARKSLRLISYLISICLLLLTSVFTFAEPICSVLFYNPESNIQNFASLKTGMDRYLKKSGAYRFQPFFDRFIFENQFKDNMDVLCILSSWHYKIIKNEYGLKPVLVGVIDGKTTQKKILSCKKNISNIKMLKGARIASAGSDDYTRNLLIEMLGKGNKELVDSFQLLGVPKDIDALISVGFGLAEAALTTENSLEMLSSINLRLHKKLITLASSEDILLPVVAVPKNCNPQVIKLSVLLKGMATTKEGNKGISILGLDEWKKLEEKDRQLLK